ncbi:hypothetical protein D9M70_457640 [compost metagenome]
MLFQLLLQLIGQSRQPVKVKAFRDHQIFLAANACNIRRLPVHIDRIGRVNFQRLDDP